MTPSAAVAPASRTGAIRRAGPRTAGTGWRGVSTSAARLTGRRFSGCRTAARSSAASVVACGRAAGSVASARSTAFARRRGRSGRRLASAGAPRSIARATSCSGMPQNGCWPASASQRTTPTAHTSLAGVASSPPRRSGAMYASVPGTSPTAVSVSAPSNCARPKSRSLTAMSSECSSSMFEGFTSRWTIPVRCAWASASSTCAAISTASTSPTSSLRSASRTVRPGTYS